MESLNSRFLVIQNFSRFSLEMSARLNHIPKLWVAAAVGILFFTIMGAALWLKKTTTSPDRPLQTPLKPKLPPPDQVPITPQNTTSTLPNQLAEPTDEEFQDAETTIDGLTEGDRKEIEELPSFYSPIKPTPPVVPPPKISHEQKLKSLLVKFFSTSEDRPEIEIAEKLLVFFAPHKVRSLDNGGSTITITYASPITILTQNLSLAMFNNLPIRLATEVEAEIGHSEVRTLAFTKGAPHAEMTLGKGWLSVTTTVSLKTLSYDSKAQTLNFETDSSIVNVALSALPSSLEGIKNRLTSDKFKIEG